MQYETKHRIHKHKHFLSSGAESTRFKEYTSDQSRQHHAVKSVNHNYCCKISISKSLIEHDEQPMGCDTQLAGSIAIYTLNHKKRDILFLTITLANFNRFL